MSSCIPKAAHELAFGYNRIAGVDEAGRGPLAGPVVAAACILDKSVDIPGINDSKKLTPKQRERLYQELTSHSGVTYGIGIVEAAIIDEINILQATFQAMLYAVQQLICPPDFILIDGNQSPACSIPTQCIIGGDSSCISISAASIIAKHTRDLIMQEYHHRWPCYNFQKNKGYGTREHLEALSLWGISPIHRRSFAPCKTFKKIGIGS